MKQILTVILLTASLWTLAEEPDKVKLKVMIYDDYFGYDIEETPEMMSPVHKEICGDHTGYNLEELKKIHFEYLAIVSKINDALREEYEGK